MLFEANTSVAVNCRLAWAKSQGSTCQGHFKPSENTANFICQHLICQFLA